jgi:DNA-binding transcriptional MocR family regulator
MPGSVLQYGPTEGEPDLRRAIAEDLQRLGLDAAPDQVLILSGSQQGIDLAAKLFVDPGTPVGVEEPTYLAALQVLRFFGARMTALRSPEAALAYAIPTFQNPTGHCYSAEERRGLAAHCDAAGIPLFEDDPYRDLVFDPVDRTPACAYLRKAPWIYQGSFSKNFAPGLRLGFLAASRELFTPLMRLKQAADLHSNRASQWLVLKEMRSAGREERLQAVVAFYRKRRDRFAESLARHLGDMASWSVPAGGLFFWLELKSRIDTRALLPRAIERGVAFMPGEPFFAENTGPRGMLRLNFSHATEEQSERGLAILAELIREQFAKEGAPAQAQAKREQALGQ